MATIPNEQFKVITSPESIERFWAKVNRGAEDECWEWQGARYGNGHGNIGRCGRNHGAHRVSWMIHFGEISDDAIICHHCDNPPCVNPKHLYAGSFSTNLQDMYDRNRRGDQRRERNGNAKLTPEQVRYIRSHFKPRDREFGGSALGRRFGVSQAHVSRIAHGTSWEDV